MMGIDYCSDAPGPCTHKQLRTKRQLVESAGADQGMHDACDHESGYCIWWGRNDSVTVSIPRQYGKQQALEFDAIVQRMRELGVAAWQPRETSEEQDD